MSWIEPEIGNALAGPSLTSLGSKSASAAEQGSVLGVMQSVASLARAVGPTIAALIIYSGMAHIGYDLKPQNMSDASILRTFWTAAAIQFASVAAHLNLSHNDFLIV